MYAMYGLSRFFLVLGAAMFFLFGIHSANAQVDTDVDADQVDRHFAEWDEEGSPGCALGVYHEGDILYEAGYGEANLDHGVPIEPDTRFYIGSVSKQFAAAAIAILADRGEIGLGDDVREHVPEMPKFEEGTITVADLVHHTSGLRDIYSLMSVAGINVADVLSLEEMVELIASQSDLNFPPGEEYLYSNSGYTLMTAIVENVSGQSLRQFADANIFEPLGMEATHFHDERTKVVPNRAMSYGPDEEGGFYQSYLGNFEGVGPGGLYTTVRDLLAWDRNFEENRIPDAPNFNELMHTRGELNNGETLDYAFGLQIGEHKGTEVVGHGGSFMGFRADYQRFPEHDFSVATLCNLGTISPSELTEKVAREYLDEPFSAHLDDYEGTYHSDDFGVTFALEEREGQLHLDREAGVSPRGAMSYSDPDEFSVDGWTVEFERDPDTETIEAFEMSTGRAHDVRFERQ